ncbi:ArsR/SmtB family transcription factor [Sporolactobacillus kofuensis]|uniref:ArsR/SmtB family transcription factor n=1 Tax=Sporolactobacillus kofuensis TaxID=269672 RepID=A0ABW1WER2_9BACL|nr:metalloregulator ArsR/SmtB family transcription factor [Sporolactobacillus kofuensis]MCO7175714.1 metalloregulator ArsR/SmtB family transcription factor [Sporolactobacillus kofuensis]
MSFEISDVTTISSTLKLLGDRTRLTILSLLNHQELCVCELVDLLTVSQPAMSQHLKKLRLAGLIRERKQGTWVYYSLNEEIPHYVSVIIDALPDQKIETCRNPQCCASE